MALTKANADAVATAFCSAISVTDASAIAKWKSLMENIYEANSGSLVNAITATISASSIVTTGSATTQTGPASPVNTVIS